MNQPFNLSIAAIFLTLLPTITLAADFAYECLQMALPFDPKTDENGGALWITKGNQLNTMSPLLIIIPFCGTSAESEASKARAREKFISDEKEIKSRCVDSLDQRTIQHRSNFTERRFACTQNGRGGKLSFVAGSYIELDGNAAAIGYVNDAPRNDAEAQLELILESLKSR